MSEIKMLAQLYSLWRLWGRVLPCLFLLLAVSPWHSLACSCITPQIWTLFSHDHFLSVLVHIAVSFLFLRTQVMFGLGLTLIQHNLILLYLQRPYFQFFKKAIFQIRPYLQLSEVRTSTCLFFSSMPFWGTWYNHGAILLRFFGFYLYTNRIFLVANDGKHKLA